MAMTALLEEGESFASAGRYARAVETFERILADDPANEAALAGKISALRSAKRYADADQALESAVDGRPPGESLAPEVAALFADEGRFDEAVAVLDAAGGVEAVRAQADKYAWTYTETDKCIADRFFTAALAQFPGDDQLRTEQAKIRIAQGRFEEAIDLLWAVGEDQAVAAAIGEVSGSYQDPQAKLADAAIKRFPASSPLLEQRARLYLEAGRYAEAVATSDRALERGSSAAAATKIQALVAAKRYAEADRAVEVAIGRRNRETEFLREATALYVALGQYDRAIDVLVRSGSESAVEAVVASPLSDEPRALELLDAAVKRFPKNAGVRAIRAESRQRLGHHEDAIADADACLRLRPEDLTALRAKYRALLALRQYDTAAELIAESPEFPDSEGALALIALERERFADAVEMSMVSGGAEAVRHLVGNVRSSDGSGPGLARAERLIDAALNRMPADRELLAERAQLLLADDRWEEAAKAFAELGVDDLRGRVRDATWNAYDPRVERFARAASACFPEDAELQLQVATLYERQSAYDKALAVLDRYLEGHGMSVAIAAAKVRVLRQAGRIVEAEQTLSETENEGGLNDELLVERARLLSAQERHDEAVRAFIASGYEYNVVDELRLRLSDGRLDEARSLAEAIEGQMSDAAIAAELGMAYLRLQEWSAALRASDRVLAVTPLSEEAREIKAIALRLKKRNREAKKVIDDGLAELPRSDRLLLQRGWIALQLHDYATALASFDAALVNDESNDHGLQGKMSALIALGRFEDAENFYSSTAEDRRSADFIKQLGWLCVAREQYSRAADAFKLAFETATSATAGESAAELYDLGNGLDAAKCYSRAIESYDEAIRRDPDLVYARHNRAATLWNRGAFPAARQAWDETRASYRQQLPVAERRGSPDDFMYFGSVLVEVYREFDEAERIFQIGLELNPENLGILIWLANLYRERESETSVDERGRDGGRWGSGGLRGVRRRQVTPAHDGSESVSAYWRSREHYQLAVRLLEEQLELHRDAETLRMRGELALAVEDLEKAESCFVEGLKLDPSAAERASLLKGMGVVRMRRPDYAAAVRYFRDAVNRDADSLETRANLAEALLKDKQTADAEREYRRVLEIGPEHIQSLIGLGQVYSAMGDSEDDGELFDLAVRYFSDALTLSGNRRGSKQLTSMDQADVLYARGYARVASWERSAIVGEGSPSSAKKDFKACLALNPTHYRARRALAKIDEREGRFSAQWLGEKVGPAAIALLAFAVFVVTQVSFVGGVGRDLGVGYYVLLTFGALLFMVAGLYLPRILKLKVGALELEKSVVEQVATTGGLGISPPAPTR